MVHHSFRRHSMGGGSVSLGETLEAGRGVVHLGKQDHGVSMSSGFTVDPTERTERSVSSSVCLSETGEVMVTTKRYTSKRITHDSPLPPPPFALEHKDLRESRRKPKSFRRRSMFGSSTPMPKFPEESVAPRTRLGTESEFVGSPVVVKPPSSQRRRSFFGSGLTCENGNMPQKCPADLPKENELHVVIDASPAKPKSFLRQGRFIASIRSIDSNGTDERSDDASNNKRKSKNMVNAFLQKTNRLPAIKSEEATTTISRQDMGELEATEKTKKPLSWRHNSLFLGASKDSQDHGVAATASKPPATPTKSPRRRRRRSLFGNASSGCSNHEDAAPPAAPAPHDQKHQRANGFLRKNPILGGGIATVTASLTPSTPRSHNPYELINNERSKRKLQPFTRSMLLDSVAKDVAVQLSRSNGTQCRPTDYFGNIGKGIDVWTIHQKMMSQKGTEKANILASQFYHYGIGMSRGSDGQIYICHLFQ